MTAADSDLIGDASEPDTVLHYLEPILYCILPTDYVPNFPPELRIIRVNTLRQSRNLSKPRGQYRRITKRTGERSTSLTMRHDVAISLGSWRTTKSNDVPPDAAVQISSAPTNCRFNKGSCRKHDTWRDLQICRRSGPLQYSVVRVIAVAEMFTQKIVFGPVMGRQRIESPSVSRPRCKSRIRRRCRGALVGA